MHNQKQLGIGALRFQQKSKKIIYIFSVFVLVSVVYVTFVSEIYGKKSRPSDDVFLNSQTIKIPSY